MQGWWKQEGGRVEGKREKTEGMEEEGERKEIEEIGKEKVSVRDRKEGRKYSKQC